MCTLGEHLRRRAAPHAANILLVGLLASCTEATLQNVPGDLAVTLQFNPGTIPTSGELVATFSASWQSLPPGATDVSLFSGTTSASGRISQTPSQQQVSDPFPTATGLRAGSWQVSVSVTSGGVALATPFPATCNAVPVRV